MSTTAEPATHQEAWAAELALQAEQSQLEAEKRGLQGNAQRGHEITLRLADLQYLIGEARTETRRARLAELRQRIADEQAALLALDAPLAGADAKVERLRVPFEQAQRAAFDIRMEQRRRDEQIDKMRAEAAQMQAALDAAPTPLYAPPSGPHAATPSTTRVSYRVVEAGVEA